eukprot:105794-Pyramimonas_sp.AAC.1
MRRRKRNKEEEEEKEEGGGKQKLPKSLWNLHPGGSWGHLGIPRGFLKLAEISRCPQEEEDEEDDCDGED